MAYSIAVTTISIDGVLSPHKVIAIRPITGAFAASGVSSAGGALALTVPDAGPYTLICEAAAPLINHKILRDVPAALVPTPDFIAGALMFQDAAGTDPVTAAGQRMRCWRNSAGGELIADTAAGWSVRNLGGVLTPYLTLTEGGGLVATGAFGAGTVVHQIATLQAGAHQNCFGALHPPGSRANECWTYGDIRGGIYNGSGVVNGTSVLTATNKTLYTAVFDAMISLRVNGVTKITHGPLAPGAQLTAIGRIPAVGAVNAATALHRLRISNVATLAADELELAAFVPARPAPKLCMITDSNFSDVVGSTNALGVNGRFTATHTVIANTIPGGGVVTDGFPAIAAAGPYVAVVSCYTNDINDAEAAVVWTNIKAAFDAIGGSGLRIAVSPWDRPGFPAHYNARAAALRALIDGDPAYVHINGATVVGANLGDNIHPNEAGCAALEAAIRAAL